jgi:hypothetical protein
MTSNFNVTLIIVSERNAKEVYRENAAIGGTFQQAVRSCYNLDDKTSRGHAPQQSAFTITAYFATAFHGVRNQGTFPALKQAYI